MPKAESRPTETDVAFEGHVDFYGHHEAAGGWFLGGWLSHPWTGVGTRDAVAGFAGATVETKIESAFYRRADVIGRGVGFIFFLAAPASLKPALRSLRVAAGKDWRSIQPTPGARRMADLALASHLLGLLGDEGGPQIAAMRQRIVGGQAGPAVTGFTDAYGFNPVAGGWFFCGWVSAAWPAPPGEPWRATASFTAGEVAGECLAVPYPRDDVPAGAAGFVLLLRTEQAPGGLLVSLALAQGTWRASLPTAFGLGPLAPAECAERMGSLLRQAPGTDGDALASLLARQPFRGKDTLAALQSPVLLEIDEAIIAGPDGLVLMGWLLAHPGEVRTIRVRCGQRASVLDLAGALRVARSDVIEGHAEQGFTDPQCGFIAYLPDAVTPGERIYIEVETAGREIGYRTVKRPVLSGIAAIKRLLGATDPRFTEVRDAFDSVLGPAVAALNQARLAVRPATLVTGYGQGPASPRCSVVIPLYGRLDYVEYQLALFSAHPGAAAVEFIYVLDDPARRREAQFLFASVHERFGLPFKTVLLDTNVGFAPATNIGLQHATGRYVAFVNSDVFPGTPDWIERLTARLEADPDLGAIGPVLLFEDGTVQHNGMAFKRLPEFGDLYFGMHPGKGMRGVRSGGVEVHPSITGACMVLPRALAAQAGGFDETFVIGDFEDSDLCLRLQALGYRCAVDTGVELLHLERKSQAGSGLGWRMNLTVYNAWQHHRRWAATIAARHG